MIPVPFRSKNPGRQGWQNERYSLDDLPAHFNGRRQNLGLLLGDSSGGLVDIDLDTPEAIAAADRFLPATGCIFGRESKRRSHRLYCTSPVLSSSQYQDTGEKPVMLLECRSTGRQTIVPPSVHETGEPIEWETFTQPAAVDADELRRAVSLVAVTTLLARHWPQGPGIRHELACAWAGYLLRRLLQDDVEAVIRTASEIGNDEEAYDRQRVVTSTVRALGAGNGATGGPTVAQLLPAVGSQLLDRLDQWLPAGRHKSAQAREQPTSQTAASPVHPPAPSLRRELLPPALATWIRDEASLNCVPLESVAVPAVVGLAAMVGARVRIIPDRYSDKGMVPNLWGVYVARPGEMKSATIDAGLRPVMRIEAERLSSAEERKKDVEPTLIRIDAQIAGIKKAMEKAGAEQDSTKLDALQDQLERLMEQHAKLATPTPRLITNDTTVEKLGTLLAENPNGLLLKRDELTGWLYSLERKDRVGDRPFYLEAWEGGRPFVTDRIGRGTVVIPSHTLSVFGTMQPGPLQRYVSDAITGGRGDDGLIQRFQLLVWPDSLPPYEPLDRWPDREAKERAFQLYGVLGGFDPCAWGAQAREDGPPAYHFSFDAQARYTAWRIALESQLRSGDLENRPAFAAHLSKYRSLVPTLALLFHLLDLADNGQPGPVSLVALELALGWVVFLEEHAVKLYAGEVSRAAVAGAKPLLSNTLLLELVVTLEDRVRHGKLAIQEIVRAYRETHGIEVPPRTISDRLKQLGLRHGNEEIGDGRAAMYWDPHAIRALIPSSVSSERSEPAELSSAPALTAVGDPEVPEETEDSGVGMNGRVAVPTCRACGAELTLLPDWGLVCDLCEDVVVASSVL